MRLARRDIVNQEGMVSITWRCHNREFYLTPDHVKEKIRAIWLKWKIVFKVYILTYTILDNHVHFVLWVKDQKQLSAFLQATNSQISKYINKTFEKDSAAIKDRFRSPMIQNEKSLFQVVAYIAFNAYRAFKVRPEDYRYCSIYYQLKGLKDPLVDSFEKVGIHVGPSIKNFIKNILDLCGEKFLNKTEDSEISVIHPHSIGDLTYVQERKEYFKLLYNDP